jgi:hypothetical protein
MKRGGDLAEEMPEGYEVYENPTSGQVLLRKIQPQRITDEEKKSIEKHVKAALGRRPFVMDVHGSIVTVFESVNDFLPDAEYFKSLSDRPEIDSEWLRVQAAYHAPSMRFCLEDAQKRIFLLERYGFNGSTETWIPAGCPDILENLFRRRI